MFVWNLPPVATCPGASEWCTVHCYNADPRTDIFPLKKWLNNWALSHHTPKIVEKYIVHAIRSVDGKVALRIHSSGDFYSIPYIRLWQRIVKSLPETDFWTYTRSWVFNDLLAELETLRLLKNIQVFASWDTTMPPPPPEWRKAIVVSTADEIQSSGIICPEQTNNVPDCAHCRYCIRGDKGDVFFIIY